MLVSLSDKSGKQVWVNALLVREIRPRKVGCDVLHGPSGHVRTDEPTDAVVQRVNEAALTMANPAAIAAVLSQSTSQNDEDGAAALGVVF